jgi:hypothetical protein
VTDDTTALRDFLKYARSKHPDMAVIALSENLSLEQMRSIITTGVDHVLLRPFTLDQLIQKIQAAHSFRSQVLNEKLPAARSAFTSKLEEITDNYYKVVFQGNLIENSVLPTVPEGAKDATLFLDCEHLRGINSIGIRSWMLWFKALQTKGFRNFEFDKLHPPILQQASFVAGFIPAGAIVNSFYLYYWCEEFDEEKEFCIQFGKHYGTTQMKLPKYFVESRDNKIVRFDLDQTALKLVKFYQGEITVAVPKEP